MRTRDLKNNQKVFEKVAEFLVFTPEDQIGYNDFYDEDGRFCAIGSLMNERVKRCIRNRKFDATCINTETSKFYNFINPILMKKIVSINDETKRSRRPQKLRALAKKMNLKIPEWLSKSNLGY